MSRDPKKINSFVLFDFENGGICKEDNKLTPQKYATIEFAGLAMNGVTLEEIVKYDNLIKPYDVGLQYSLEAQKIHGITKEQCEKEGLPLKEVVNDICQLFEEANLHRIKTAKPILVAHNAQFDIVLLQDIFLRCRVDLGKYVSGYYDRNGLFHPSYLDTIFLAKMIDAEKTDTDTKFNMEACCTRHGVDLHDAHRAINDVLALSDLFRIFVMKMRSGGDKVSLDKGQVSRHRKTFQW